MISLDGTALVSLVLRLPFVGVWTADVEVPATTAPVGAVTLTADTGETFRGAVLSGGLSAGVWRGVLVGGAGGLRRALDPTHYHGATAADVVLDALSLAGEARAPGGADLSAIALQRWVRRAQSAARTVADVAQLAAVRAGPNVRPIGGEAEQIIEGAAVHVLPLGAVLADHHASLPRDEQIAVLAADGERVELLALDGLGVDESAPVVVGMVDRRVVGEEPHVRS